MAPTITLVRRLLIACVVIGGLTACSSSPTLTHAGSGHGTGRPFTIGEPAIERASGATVTVLGFDQGPLTSDYIPANAASRLTAADVKVCEGRTGAWRPDPDRFTLQVPDHDPIAQTLPAKLPALDVTGLRPGTCVEGWLTFMVPNPAAGPTSSGPTGPTYVRYRDQDSSAMWRAA